MSTAKRKYKPYPKYKDSGVEWLGRVPEHWDVKRLRHVAPFSNSNVDKKSYEGQKPVRLCNYTDVYYNEFIRDGMEFMEATASDAEIKRFQLRRGQILITKDSEDPTDIGIPSLVTEDMEEVICGYHLTVIFPKDYDTGRYLHRSIQSVHTRAHFYVESPGITRYGLNQDTIADTPVALPNPKERKAIADFIERECGRMDKLVEKKQEFIALLKDKRQALITHAVTKGLNPKTAMKDSGVEWLGMVPKHWDVKKVKYTSQIIRGKFTHRPRNDPKLYGGEFRFVQTGDVARAGKYITEYSQTLNALGFSVSKQFPKGTLTMTIAANIGEVAILNFDACFPDSIVGFVPLEGILLDFLYYSFLAMKSELLKEAPVSTQGNLNVERVGGMPITIPDECEQMKVVKYIEIETTRIDRLIAKTLESIDLLKERKTALITAAVTGQIDVSQSA